MPTWYYLDSFVGYNHVTFALDEVISVEMDEQLWLERGDDEAGKSSFEVTILLRGACQPLRARCNKKEADDFMAALRVPDWTAPDDNQTLPPGPKQDP